jgi:hypothetical protein
VRWCRHRSAEVCGTVFSCSHASSRPVGTTAARPDQYAWVHGAAIVPVSKAPSPASFRTGGHVVSVAWSTRGGPNATQTMLFAGGSAPSDEPRQEIPWLSCLGNGAVSVHGYRGIDPALASASGGCARWGGLQGDRRRGAGGVPVGPQAVGTALEARLGLAMSDWAGRPGPLGVGMALHTGAVEPDPDGDYRSPVLNRLGRLLGAGAAERGDGRAGARTPA